MTFDKELEEKMRALEEQENGGESSFEPSEHSDESEDSEEEKWEYYHNPISASEEEEQGIKPLSDEEISKEIEESDDLYYEDLYEFSPHPKKPRMDKEKSHQDLDENTSSKTVQGSGTNRDDDHLKKEPSPRQKESSKHKDEGKEKSWGIPDQMLPKGNQIEEVVKLPSGRRIARHLIPAQKRDPRGFPVSILINVHIKELGLADSGASVSIMLYRSSNEQASRSSNHMIVALNSQTALQRK